MNKILTIVLRYYFFETIHIINIINASWLFNNNIRYNQNIWFWNPRNMIYLKKAKFFKKYSCFTKKKLVLFCFLLSQ